LFIPDLIVPVELEPGLIESGETLFAGIIVPEIITRPVIKLEYGEFSYSIEFTDYRDSLKYKVLNKLTGEDITDTIDIDSITMRHTDGKLPPGLIIENEFIVGKVRSMDADEYNKEESPAFNWFSESEYRSKTRSYVFELELEIVWNETEIYTERKWFEIGVYHNWDLERDFLINNLPLETVTENVTTTIRESRLPEFIGHSNDTTNVSDIEQEIPDPVQPGDDAVTVYFQLKPNFGNSYFLITKNPSIETGQTMETSL